MNRRTLEVLRWSLTLLAVAAVVGIWVQPHGSWAGLMFLALVLAGFPAAMLSMHLQPPKWFRALEDRRKRR